MFNLHITKTEWLNIFQTNDDKYRDALIALYIGCFSSGLSAQYIDEDQLSDYIDFILNKGYGVLAIETGWFAALLCFPLKYDKDIADRNNWQLQCWQLYLYCRANGDRAETRIRYSEKVVGGVWKQAGYKRYGFIHSGLGQKCSCIDIVRKQGFTSVAINSSAQIWKSGANQLLMRKMYLHKKPV